ncbi:outer membrane protein transport protein [Histidinibacterium aquaticum]|uniref:Transporter n=1 Tax=Histidinibacterium aquaticum TaxID=2613962 RepID=A0A5J5GLP1_9RHOB|nr:outer membrane protein transport protein [Histidinibacterium aquaticum]KAA9009219.1 hypothetical protein F3S47_08170 [Histidinibacterium aquaticum]
MQKHLTAAAALLVTTTAAQAGGIDRGRTDYGVLFEPGNYIQLGATLVQPDVSGDYPAAFGGGSTGDMSDDYVTPSFALKMQLNDRLGLGLFAGRPFGADATYSQGLYTGLNAEWDSEGMTAVLKYDVNPNFSVYGGARYVTSTAEIAIPDALIRGGFQAAAQAGNAQAGAIATLSPAGALAYTAETDNDGATSFVGGVAYQRPEIALRVSLTYEQGYTHEFDTVENLAGVPTVGPGFESTTEIEMPDTWTLDFQTGVAPGTLVFGSVRYAEWDVWEVRPTGYDAVFNDNITDFDTAVTTYQVGVGRQITENFSGFVRATYEASDGNEASRLAPTDGTKGIGIGGTYAMDNSEVTVGIEYQQLGDATTADGTEFEDNSALGVGITFGHSF